MDFGPSACSATVYLLPCFPSVKRTSFASYFVIFCPPSLSSKPCLHCEFILQKFEESHDILLTAWTMCSFLGFAPPWLACWDCLKGLFAFVSALSLSWGFKSMDTHTSQCGDNANFTIHFLLGHCSLLFAVVSSYLCTCWNCLCHKRYEVLALHFTGGGTLYSWWLHYFRF